MKKIMSLLFVLGLAGVSIQAADVPDYQYGQNNSRGDLWHFQEKYIDLLMINNLQLNDDQFKAMMSEVRSMWMNNDWSIWVHYRDLTENDFIEGQLTAVRQAAQERLAEIVRRDVFELPAEAQDPIQPHEIIEALEPMNPF